MKIKKANTQKNDSKRTRLTALMLAMIIILSALLISCGKDNDGKKAQKTTAAQSIPETTASKTDSADPIGSSSAAKSQSSAASDTAPATTQSTSGAIIVPDVAGKTESEAVSLLESMGLSVKVSHKDNEEVEKGLVIGTDREVGQELKKGDKIFVYISDGKPFSFDDPYVDPLVEARGKKEQGANKDYVPINYETVKAMWLSQLDLNTIFCNTMVQREEADYTQRIKTVMQNVKSTGCNTVFVQLRPNADSMYPSEYYPWSKYVVGSYGIYGTYDPLKIMIDAAHEQGLSIHGWINPMRGFDSGSIEVINVSYPMKQWYTDADKHEYMSLIGDLYILNPAYKEVRELITNGAAEIVRYYDIDGIHMDDYYYPSDLPDDFDSIAFADSEFVSLTKFRQNNISLLLSEMYTAIKSENPNVIFGISPVRNIWMCKNVSMLDLDTILSNEGYIDYICPQIYEGFVGMNGGFKKLYNEWSDLVKSSKIKLLVGLWFQDAINETGSEWKESKDILKRCVEYMQESHKFSGFALFCYQNLFSPSTGVKANSCTEEAENLIKTAKLIPDIKIEY